MILPKKLQPRTEHDILKEVSDELKINIKDVNKTFNIWLDYLDHIANDTDQCSVYLPNLGTMFVSVVKMRRGTNVGKWKKFKEAKLREISKLKESCQYIVHEKTQPIVLMYGLAKRNKYGKEEENGKKEYFTMRDIINNQTDIFFNEDFEYSEEKKLKKYFIDETD